MANAMANLQKETKLPINILDLADDCIFHIFDWLPTDDLFNVSETSTRLFDLAGIHYQHKHPNKFVLLSTNDENTIQLKPDDKAVQYFGRKFRHLIIRGESRHCRITRNLLEFLLQQCRTDLRSIRFERLMLDESQLTVLKPYLENCTTIILHECNFVANFYCDLLRYCQRLRHLTISDSYGIIEPDEVNLWLLQKYPALESLHICSVIILTFRVDPWAIFLRNNPQLKSLSCDRLYALDPLERPIKVITQNMHRLERVFFSLRGIGHLNSAYYDLSILCKSKSIKLLELQFETSNDQFLIRHIKLLATINELQGLHFVNVVMSEELCAAVGMLTNLKRLYFRGTVVNDSHWNILFNSLHNLREVYLDRLAPEIPAIPYEPNHIDVIIHKYQKCEANVRFFSSDITVQTVMLPDGKAYRLEKIVDDPWAMEPRFLLHVNNTFLQE